MTKKLTVIAVLLTMLFSVSAVFANGGQEDQEIVLEWPCIWVGQDSKAPAVAALVEEFNADHEGEIRVEIEPQPDYDGYEQKIRTSLATGEVPDIFTMKWNPTTQQYYESEYLMDFSGMMSSEWREDFIEGTLNEVVLDGEMKSIPYEMAITPIWYNMDLLNEAGFSEIPQTMEEFNSLADALKENDIVPTSQMTGGSNAWTSMLWYSHILGSLGGPDVYDMPLTDQVYVDAAEILLNLYSDGNTTRDAVGGDAGVSGGHYLAGRTAMFINGPWYIGRVREDAPDVYEATQVGPAPAAGEYEDAMVGFLQANFAAADSDDADRNAAVIEFLQWMTAPENVWEIASTAGSMFAVKFDVPSDAEIDPLQAQFIETANEAEFQIRHLEGAFSSELISEFGQALGAMALGEATPEEFVDMLIEASN